MRSSSWRRLRLFLGIVALAWGVMVNLFLVGNLFCAACIPVMVVLNHLAAWVTLVSLLAFSLAFTLRASLKLTLWLVPGVAAFVWWYAPLWLPKTTPHVKGIAFTAMTYNVLGFQADPNQTFKVIQNGNADIVALEELRPTLEKKLKDDLSERYPFQVSNVVQGFDGLALLSRFPILESQVFLDIDFSAIDLNRPHYLRAVVDIDGHPVVVYVIHPPIPQPSYWTAPLYQFLYRYDDSRLQTHIERTVKLIQAETLPVLLLCDCNSTPRSRQYKLLDGVLDEAFRAQGWGLGLTHPARPFPLLRIDYLWYSKDFTALEAKVWPESGTSDHFPVWGKLVLRLS